MLRILHTADIHLDAPFAMLPAAKRPLRRQSLRRALKKLVETAIERRVDALVVAGDLFDSAHPSADTLAFVLSQFDLLDNAGIPAVVLPGNHDFLAEGTVYSTADLVRLGHVFRGQGWEAWSLPGKGVFIGAPCAGVSSNKNPFEQLPATTGGPELPRVGLVHGSLDYGSWEGEQCNPFRVDDVDKAGFDYLALGHYHTHTRLKSKAVACYSGSPEGLAFSESGPRRAVLAEIDGGAVKIDLVGIGEYTYDNRELDCTAIAGSHEIVNEIKAEASPHRLLRVKLTGAPPTDLDINTDHFLDALGDDFFYLDIVDGTILPPEFADDDSLTVKAAFSRRMKEMIEVADDEEQKAKLSLAVRLGLSALEGRLK